MIERMIISVAKVVSVLALFAATGIMGDAYGPPGAVLVFLGGSVIVGGLVAMCEVATNSQRILKLLEAEASVKKSTVGGDVSEQAAQPNNKVKRSFWW